MQVILRNKEHQFTNGMMRNYIEATVSFQCSNENALLTIMRDLELRSEETGLPVIFPLIKTTQSINSPETDWEKERKQKLKLQSESNNVEIPSNSIDTLEL